MIKKIIPDFPHLSRDQVINFRSPERQFGFTTAHRVPYYSPYIANRKKTMGGARLLMRGSKSRAAASNVNLFLQPPATLIVSSYGIPVKHLALQVMNCVEPQSRV